MFHMCFSYTRWSCVPPPPAIAGLLANCNRTTGPARPKLMIIHHLMVGVRWALQVWGKVSVKSCKFHLETIIKQKLMIFGFIPVLTTSLKLLTLKLLLWLLIMYCNENVISRIRQFSVYHNVDFIVLIYFAGSCAIRHNGAHIMFSLYLIVFIQSSYFDEPCFLTVISLTIVRMFMLKILTLPISPIFPLMEISVSGHHEWDERAATIRKLFCRWCAIN